MYNSLSYKTKQFFWLTIKFAIVIGCGYFIYLKLITNEQLHFSSFYQILIENKVFSVENIIFLLIFTFFNWFFEIYKWHVLISSIGQFSIYEVAKQSLSSLTVSLITPNRIGEYGAKALYFKKKDRKRIVGLNFMGNFYQLLATVIFGSIGFGYFIYYHQILIDFQMIFTVLITAIFVIIVFYFIAKKINYKGYSIEKIKTFIYEIPIKLTIKVCCVSFLRFLVFSHQLYFLLLLFKVDISYVSAISAISTVYLLSSIVPMLSLFDVVLKGSVAIWVFSFFNVEPIYIFAIITLMWLLNFVIPATIGSFFVFTFKPNLAK